MLSFFEHKTTVLQSRREKEILDFPLHMHTYIEFLYLKKGKIVLNYPSRSYELNAGDFAVIFPYTIHGYTTLSKSKETDYFLAVCKSELMSDFATTINEKHPSDPIVKKENLHADIPDLMKELTTLNGKNEEISLIKAIVNLIFIRSIKQLDLRSNTGAFNQDTLVKAVTYINRHFSENVTLKAVANEVGISEFSLSRLFSTSVGVSFVKYLNLLRLNYAENLLLFSDKSISEIALESGFGTIRTFNRVFVENKGITPRQYRNDKI